MSATTQHNRWVPYVFMLPFLVVLGVFLAYPLYFSVELAVQQTYGPKSRAYVGLDNFRFLANDPLFWKALKNTTIFAAGSVLIQLPVSLGACAVAESTGRARACVVPAGVLFALAGRAGVRGDDVQPDL